MTKAEQPKETAKAEQSSKKETKTAQSKKVTKTGRPKTNFFFGFNPGNGFIKIVGEGFERRIPSYRIDEYVNDIEGCVKVDGREFTIGENATKNQKHVDNLVDDPFGKVNDLDIYYLAALSHMKEIPKTMHNRIVISSHAHATHKQQIKDQLNKPEREVILAGKTVKITTEVLLVVPEGFGAVYKNKENLATLDFGNGTTILTPYSKGKFTKAKIEKYGVHNLFEEIAEDMARIYGGYPGDVKKIRTSIERGDYKVNFSKSKKDEDTIVSIRDIYEEAVKKWWKKGLSKICKEAVDLSLEGTKIICIGGGVALPGFKELLIAKGFKPVDKRPEMADVKGLYQLAVEWSEHRA